MRAEERFSNKIQEHKVQVNSGESKLDLNPQMQAAPEDQWLSINKKKRKIESDIQYDNFKYS